MTEPTESTRAAGCVVCGAELAVASTGRPRRYCSGACRTRAWAARRYATPAPTAPVDVAPAPAGGAPDDRHVTIVPGDEPAPVGARTARQWAAVLDELSAELLAGPLGRRHYDHRHLYAALLRAYGALDHAHPGGIDDLDRHHRRR
ncbi:hypothetical protein [Frankia torreyi]|nr:hypothetical protein [Frankia torreyi]